MNFNKQLAKYDRFIFGALCVLITLIQCVWGLDDFYWDSRKYWVYSRMFVQEGGFSIYNYTFNRGVLFPLFNFGLIELFAKLGINEIIAFKLIMSVFTIWGLWFVLPALYTKAVSKVMSVPSKLILVMLTNIFWFQYFSCPLTDFICLFLLLHGFVLLWKQKVGFTQLLVVGFICGFVMNTRPIYNLLIAVYPLFYLMVSKESRMVQLSKIVVLLGAFIVTSMPQYLLNAKVWNTQSLLQPTAAYYKGQSLYLGQLKWGLYIQKYETYIGDSNCYESAQVVFLHDKNISPTTYKTEIDTISTFGSYFQYLKRNPAALVWYWKHLFNGLDIKYNTPYITYLNPQLWLSVFNYILWFCGIAIMCLSWRRWFATKAFVLVISYLLLTCALCIPIAIEVRFLAILYLLLYLVVASEIQVLITYWKSKLLLHKVLLVGLLIVFVLSCWAVSESTYAQLEYAIHC